MSRHRPARSALFLISATACGLAVLLQHSQALPFESGQVVSQVLSSRLIPRTVPLGVVESTVAGQRFQALVGGGIAMKPASAGEHNFRLVARDKDSAVAKTRLDQATQLLSAELERIAVSEVKANRQHLADLQKDVSARMKREKSPKPGLAPEGAALPTSDAKRVLQLQAEVKDLEIFLRGGSRAGWIPTRLDRSALERQQRKVQAAKAELARLSDLWQPQSKAVQAQTKLVQREKAELASLERHLAKVLLSSHRLELKSLEIKSESIVQQNSEPEDASYQSEDPAGLSQSAQWLGRKSEQLLKEAEQLERKAALVPIGPVLTEVEEPTGYWLSLGLWLVAAAGLLGGLFLAGETDLARSGTTGRARRAGARDPKSEPPLGPMAAGSVVAKTDLPELSSDVFFQNLKARMEQELGRPPSRLLILGAPGGDERASLCLRLAKSFSNASYRVKLIDFDLQDRLLSRRIGDSNSPGVTELLANGGPVEEFFASIPETRIQFAPAGNLRVVKNDVSPEVLKRLLSAEGGITLIDASFTSPLHLVVPSMDAALCVTRPGRSWTPDEEGVLLALRESRLPIWGIAQGGSGVFPFL